MKTRNKNIFGILLLVLFCLVAIFTKKETETQNSQTAVATQSASKEFHTNTNKLEKTMLTHVVIFRTRNKEKAPLILEGLETLKQIEGVKFIHVGKPVPSERPVVDDFFDYALVVSFDDGAAGLKRYAEHPIHVNFVENYLKPAGGKILVYDIQ